MFKSTCFFIIVLLLFNSCQSDVTSLAVITGDGVRVRSTPHIQSNNDSELRLMKGDTVEVLNTSSHKTAIRIKGVEYNDPWYRVKGSKGSGWIYGAYVTMLESPSAPVAVREKYIPPPPQLYRPRVYQKPEGWLNQNRHKAEQWLKKNFGTDDQQELIQLIQACDYTNEVVRNKAVTVAGGHPGYFNLGQVCDLYDYANEKWGYVNDPVAQEYVAKASESITNGTNGDCDDYAVLLASMVVAIGGEARISYVYDYNSGHAFTEVLVGPDASINSACHEYLSARYGAEYLPGFRQDENGQYWMNLDWFSDYPAGEYFNYDHGTRFDILREQFEKL